MIKQIRPFPSNIDRSRGKGIVVWEGHKQHGSGENLSNGRVRNVLRENKVIFQMKRSVIIQPDDYTEC
jgi:hypothetical protein